MNQEKEYLVVWQINVTAASAFAAAQKAKELRYQPNSWTNVYNVYDYKGCLPEDLSIKIDLDFEQKANEPLLIDRNVECFTCGLKIRFSDCLVPEHDKNWRYCPACKAIIIE